MRKFQENAEFIEIDLEFTDEKKAGQKFWQKYQNKERKLRQICAEIDGNEKMLEVMKHSRLWRAYRNSKKYDRVLLFTRGI